MTPANLLHRSLPQKALLDTKSAPYLEFFDQIQGRVLYIYPRSCVFHQQAHNFHQSPSESYVIFLRICKTNTSRAQTPSPFRKLPIGGLDGNEHHPSLGRNNDSAPQWVFQGCPLSNLGEARNSERAIPVHRTKVLPAGILSQCRSVNQWKDTTWQPFRSHS